MRVLVVSNPNATDMTAPERDVLASALGRSDELVVEETMNRGHAAALACRAMRDGTDVVVALGGDGTVNEVVNGLLTDGVHSRVPALGIVPAGSTNVFARALGLPMNRTEATGVLLEGLRTGTRRRVSLGRLDERYFVFAAGIGFDAAIVARVERERRRGKRSSHPLYARVGVREFYRFDRRHPKLTLELPDGTVVEDIFFAIVANADPWTYVGRRPLRPTPLAGFETGLDVYGRRRMGTAGMIWSMANIVRTAPRIGRRGAWTCHDLPELVIRASEPMPIQVDGDLLDPREKVALTSEAAAIPVVMSPVTIPRPLTKQ